MNRTQELIEQVRHLTLLNPSFSNGDIETIFKAARTLNNIHTRQCNGYHFVKDEERDDKKGKKVVEQLSQLLGSAWTMQGDPRGAPIIIINENTPSEFRIWG